MDKIYSEINRETLDNTSVACRHLVSPNVKVLHCQENPLSSSCDNCNNHVENNNY
jgi:hypothetical protein